MHQANVQKRLVVSLLILFGIFTSACVTPTYTKTQPSYGGPVSLSALLSRPLSWDKLDDLSQWLDSYGSRSSARDRNDARLALADGREAYVRKDQSKVAASVLSHRGDLAKQDYRLVLDDSAATATQKSRAKNGIARLGGTYTGSAQAASSNLAKASSPTIIARSTWNAAREKPGNMSPHRVPWSRITVHHTGMPIGSSTTYASRAGEMRMLQRSHLNKAEPWGDIGYHFVIDPEGRIYEGRRLAWQGAHVAAMNKGNLGVCLMGNFENLLPTSAALASMERLLDSLRSSNGIARNAVTWHRAWPSASTDCPGTNLQPFVSRYRNGVSIAGRAHN